MKDNYADLLARLEHLENERGVLATLHRYGHAIDAGDEQAWVDCFTADGTFFAQGRHGHHTALDVTGRDALQAFIIEHSRRPYAYHLHCIVEPVIVVDGERARADSYFFVLMEHERRPVLRVFGRYRDELVHEADGRWRFRRRTATIDSQVSGLPPLAGGMARFRTSSA